MKDKIITRHIDCLGRVAIPVEFRRELGININEDINVFISEPDSQGVLTISFDSLLKNAKIQNTLGFLFIPHEFNLHDCSLDLWVDSGKLFMKKTIPQCIITGDTENLIRYKNTDKYLSEYIVRDMYHLLER